MSATVTFRISGRSAEFWDPLTGLMRRLTQTSSTASTTTLQLGFAAYGSGFVVFPVAGAESTPEASGMNVPTVTAVATYTRTFAVPTDLKPGGRLLLDLGRVEVMARVRVNGVLCGTCWTAPWSVDISAAVKPAGNTLSIEVANLWSNRMIGDAADPKHEISRTTYRNYTATSPLQPSGLLGPVKLQVESR